MIKQRGIATTVFILVLFVVSILSAYFWWSEQQQRLSAEKNASRLASKLQLKLGELEDNKRVIHNEKLKNTTLNKQLKEAQNRNGELDEALNQLRKQLAASTFGFEQEPKTENPLPTADPQPNLVPEFEQNNDLSDKASQPLEENNAALLLEKAALERQVAELKEALDTANVVKSQVQQSLDELNRSSDTVAQQYQTAQAQLDRERSLRQNYHQTIGTLEERLAKEQTALDTLQNKLGSLNELNANLHKVNEQLNVEKAQLVKQFRDGTTLIRLPNRVLFSSGSAALSAQGESTLKLVAKTLESFPEHIISVEGHSDRRTIGPELSVLYPSNWELSSARSSSAVRLLIEQGLPASQFQAVGYAETRPLDLSPSLANQGKNRRIEIILLPPVERTQKVLEDAGLKDN